ncbi:MAG: hypothetical protein D6689_19855 [Deltaproteobacteria bacterium]|nr:MAG: hypothetical protein D6689_19855 [Deltaproteobacteria bacterium]
MRQEQITRERIEAMIRRSPRRWRLRDGWDALPSPTSDAHDQALRFPFPETFGNLCNESCPVRTIGVRVDSRGRAYTYLRCSDDDLDSVRAWIDTIGAFIATRDCLALSFALDYDREDGDPSKPQTKIGRLRSQAKPYGKTPTKANYEAAYELAAECIEFLRSMPCYDTIDVIVPMPPSSPDKCYSLPAVLAERIAGETGVPWVEAARTVSAREQMKNISLDDKLRELDGTIRIDASSVQGKTVLLLDDLYQSGVSMNYVGMLLVEAGATAVLGLAVEKTCRNDDNLGGRQP